MILKNYRGDIYVPFKEGTKWTHCVVRDRRVRTVRLTFEQWTELKPVELDGKPYPIERACNQLLESGARLGITPPAQRALKTILLQLKGSSVT